MNDTNDQSKSRMSRMNNSMENKLVNPKRNCVEQVQPVESSLIATDPGVAHADPSKYFWLRNKTRTSSRP